MNTLLLTLVFLGIALIQVLIGGMRPVFVIPGYMILALAGLASVFMLRRNRPLPSLLCLGSSVLFFSYILWRAYVSPVEYLSRPDRYMVLASLIVYFIFALYITEPKLRLYLFYGLFLLGVGHVIIGAIQFTQGNGYLPFGYPRNAYGSRASGFYFCPNHYAGILEMLAVIAAAFGCWARIGIKTRMLVLYFSIMAIVGLALSGSRGGYLSIAAAFATLTFLSIVVVRWIRPRKTILIASAAILAIAAVGSAGVVLMKKNVFLSSRVTDIVDKENMRLYLWDAAIQQYHLQPATGTGAGTYYYLGRIFRDPRVYSDPIWVHNDYLHLLAEYGWLGAVACALFLGFHLWHGIAGIRQIVTNRLLPANDPSSNALAMNIGAIAAIVALLVHSIFDFNAHIPGNTLVLAALFGILANPPTFRPRNAESHLARAFPFRLVIPVCSVALILDAAPHWRGEWFAEQARVALQNSKFLKAMKSAQAGLEVEKTNPDLHYYLGEARRLFGNTMSNPIARDKMNDAALAAFRDSIKIFPQDEKLWVKMSQALDMMGRHEEAFDHLETARALDPNLSALNTYYAAHFQIQGDDKKALEYYLKAENSELAQKGRESLMKQIQADGAR